MKSIPLFFFMLSLAATLLWSSTPREYQPVGGMVGIEASGQSLFRMNALEGLPPSTDWQLEGAGASLDVVQDPGLDGGAFVHIGQEGEGDALIRVPLNEAKSGRITLRFNASSPEAKWWQLEIRAGTRTLWRQNVQLSSAGRELNWTVPYGEAHADAGAPELLLRLGGTGSVRLRHLQVGLLDESELKQAAAERFGQQLPSNLLRNSRHPLGLQSGWTLHRDSDDWDDCGSVLEGDARQRGPAGFASLRVRGGEGLIFHSEPFVLAEPGAVHRVAFYVKGAADATGHLRILEDGRPLSDRVEWTASEAWTQVVLEFPTSPLARVYGLRFETEGLLWMDDFQVTGSSDSSSVENAAPRPEVALRATRPDRVLFEEAAAEVEWLVTAAPKGAHMQAKVVNLYGLEIRLPERKLGEAASQGGYLPVDGFTGQPFGALRVEAWVEDAAGERISPYNELVVHRLRTPRYWERFAPDSPFGIHLPMTHRHLQMAKSIGLNWVRMHGDHGLYWDRIEREPGHWVFPDATIGSLREAHFEILGLLGTSPLWANAWSGEDKASIHSFWDQWGAPGDLPAFATYVEKVTQRYAADIAAFEIWNEPWVPRFFSGERQPRPKGEPLYFHSETPQADYAAISQIVRDVVPDAVGSPKLVGLNSTAG